MKYILVFIFCVFQVNAQQKVICDSVTKNPISYVAVTSPNENIGFYNFENGYFEINKNCTIYSFEHFSYKPKVNITINNLDTIFLSPKTTTIEEVFVSKRDKFISLKSLKYDNYFKSFPVTYTSEIVTFIQNKKNLSYFIDKISIPLNNSKFPNMEKINLKNYCRINIYKKNNLILEKIYESDVKIFNYTQKDKLTIEIKEENIVLNEKGIFIGLELIVLNPEMEKSRISPFLTSMESSSYFAKTYLKKSFDKKINDLSEINKVTEYTTENKHKNKNLNLALELELSH
jgi:hypothetical protein